MISKHKTQARVSFTFAWYSFRRISSITTRSRYSGASKESEDSLQFYVVHPSSNSKCLFDSLKLLFFKRFQTPVPTSRKLHIPMRKPPCPLLPLPQPPPLLNLPHHQARLRRPPPLHSHTLPPPPPSLLHPHLLFPSHFRLPLLPALLVRAVVAVFGGDVWGVRVVLFVEVAA